MSLCTLIEKPIDDTFSQSGLVDCTLASSLEGRKALMTEDFQNGGIRHLRGPQGVGSDNSSGHHVLLFTLKGRGYLDFDGKRETLLPGSVAFLPAVQDYQYGSSSSWSVLWFHLNPNEVWTRFMSAGIEIQRSSHIQTLRSIVDMYLKEASIKHPLAFPTLVGYAHLLALYLRKELLSSRPIHEFKNHEILDGLWQRILKQPDKHWTLETLSRESGFSRAHLHALCVKNSGRSLMKQVTQLRMERASYFLETTDWTVGQVAHRVGYETPFTFSRAFKHNVGVSPSEYRRDHSGFEPGQGQQADA